MLDAAIIGAGVIGSAVARELSRFRLAAAVFEAGPDVASGASKANSGIVHAGYDAKPGSRKAHYNLAGNPLFDDLSRDLDFPFRRNGSLVLGFGAADLPALEELLERGRANGVAGLEIISAGRVRSMKPPPVFMACRLFPWKHSPGGYSGLIVRSGCIPIEEVPNARAWG